MGKKIDELIRRLGTEGIPAQEAPALLREAEKEMLIERAPKANPRQFKNQTAQKLSDLWFSYRSKLTVEQKNQIGLAFISKVLGLGDDVAKRFAAGDQSAEHEVGLKQSGEVGKFVDFKGFWKVVVGISPADYDDASLALMEEKGCNRASALHLLYQIEVMLAEESPVLRALGINAHCYK